MGAECPLTQTFLTASLPSTDTPPAGLASGNVVCGEPPG